MMNELIYVYCISTSPLGLLPNIESTNLKSLSFDDFHVFVKFVSESEFSEDNFKRNLADINWLESNAREHIKVISMIMENCTVIPFNFGTIYNNKESLDKFITDYSDSLIENFQHIKGKEEWSVKIYCDRKALCGKIDELSEDAAALEKQIMASSPGKAFLLKRKKSDLIDNEMDRLCKYYGQEYFDEFKSLSEFTSLNNLLPKEFTEDNTMILNATFLVSKTKVAEFINTADTLSKKDKNSGFYIEATGPWPPFSFIYIKEK